MKEKIEFKGYWFLPENPDNRVAGILYYVPNKKIRLELIGSFDTPIEFLESRYGKKNVNPLIIHGESSDASKITLLNCSPGASSYNFSCSFPMQSFIPDYVVNGILITHANDAVFNKITLSLPHLTAWVNHYGLSYSISFKDDHPHGFNMGYNLDLATLSPLN